MLKAEQAALLNEANVAMVTLRSAEVNYFNNFFSNFGIQAAIISGLSITSISQVFGNESENGLVFGYLYWIATAVAIVSAIHVLVGALYISVFGQGLALRGPVGSMVKAVEGMAREQEVILYSFSLLMASTNLTVLFSYFVVMSFIPAVICSVINIAGMIWWYQSALRIYNRFKIMPAPEEFEDEEEDNSTGKISQKNNDSGTNKKNKVKNSGQANSLTERLIDGEDKKKKTVLNRFKNVIGIKNKNEVISETTNPINNDKLNANRQDSQEDEVGNDSSPKKITQGYLAMHEVNNMSSRWIRRYFVLKNISMNYYLDEKQYQLNPTRPINRRPICFDEYAVQDEVTADYFVLVLSPADPQDTDRVWEFRVDTMEEMRNWKKEMNRAITASNNKK